MLLGEGTLYKVMIERGQSNPEWGSGLCDVWHYTAHSDLTMCAQLLRHIWLLATPWVAAHQAPLSMEFCRRGYWSGLPFPPPSDFTRLHDYGGDNYPGVPGQCSPQGWIRSRGERGEAFILHQLLCWHFSRGCSYAVFPLNVALKDNGEGKSSQLANQPIPA